MEPLTEQNTLPEPTLREELASNLATVIQDTPEVDTAVKIPVQEISTEKLATERSRDEQGKFAKTDVPRGTVNAEVKLPSRPSSWKKDYWQDWDKLATENPKLASYLNEREGQFASGVSTYKQEWEQAKPLIDAIAPFQQILQQNNIDPAQWISNLGNAHHRLAMGSPQDKLAMFQKLAQDYQIPAQLAVQDREGQWQILGQQSMPQQPAFDQGMVERLVEKKLQETSTKQILEAFSREAPTKYQHFETVKATMAGLLQAGLADDLPSAYEAALRHPRHSDLFSYMQQQQSAKEEQERKAIQAQKVQRARSNAVSPTSSTPSGVMAQSGEKGLRDQLTENFRAVVGGRV